MNRQQLPQTDSIEELARFWDHHDITDFEDKLEEVHEPVFERAAAITIHLEAEAANALRAIAQAQGVADSELIRQWVLERIKAT